MKPGRYIAGFLLLVWLAAAFQAALSKRLGIFGAEPDFLVVLLAAVCMHLNRSAGAWAGFAIGAVHGALAGANLMHYAISRTFTGFVAAWWNDLNLERRIWLVALSGAAATLLAQTILMFLAAPPDIVSYMGATIGTAAYNGALVVPVHAALERILGPARR